MYKGRTATKRWSSVSSASFVMLEGITVPIVIFKCRFKKFLLCNITKQEAQGLGVLLDKREDDDHIKVDNIEI